ncbi:sensor histidine kinase [Oceanobacillus timonensis]|uniref:sensor histidine kinase n=1 Tax=Oceanobacillus timonensis TaxID=1926285 RepID=UPI0009BBA314|nr:sensor histidine kinase [Oceanobacillus timonensis]
MNTIIRFVLLSIACSFVLAIAAVVATFVTFSINETAGWSALWEGQIGDVSFLLTVLAFVLTFGSIIGAIIGWYWKGNLKKVEKMLTGIVKGEKPIETDDIPKELEAISVQVNQVQEKLRAQTEHAQKIATERANEREQSLQEVVEQERNRLARELHDSVSQQLFAASMLMSAINESGQPEDPTLTKQLNMVENMIHQSQMEMRALLLHLRPVALKGKSLQEGVEGLLKELTQKVPLEIDAKIEAFQVDKGVEDQLFRIFQESISNTLRHAKAANLHILLLERDENIIMRVVDDGIGFETESVKTSSYGMQNMRERAYEVGGTLKIISLPNEGTRLEVKVPIVRKEDPTND